VTCLPAGIVLLPARRNVRGDVAAEFTQNAYRQRNASLIGGEAADWPAAGLLDKAGRSRRSRWHATLLACHLGQSGVNLCDLSGGRS
jgi:hypothetical protein